MATVSISDPATCAGPSGPFAHVYVTITDVQAHVSSTAGDNDPGWKDLTPNLSKSPKQIDLLGQANNQCFLATLGDAQQLQAGNYQQIRLILADNGANIPNSLCTSSANCVVLTADHSVHTLQLSSESKTGIKIPSGQIASGGFNIAAGQTKDLDLDFNTCESIVLEGNGEYRLKPVLHAGEVSTTSTSINGKVLDKTTGNPVNGTVLVALEQKDAAGVDRIVMSTLAGADGSFVFCPIPAGTYDVVIVGERADGVAYQPSIVTSIANGETTGNVNLYAGVAGTLGSAALAGTVTSQNSANSGTVADIDLSALETVGTGTFTIPLVPNAQQPSAELAVETAASSSCPTGTDCVKYSMTLAAGGPYVGAFSASGVTLTQSSPLATYVVDGLAFVPGGGVVPDCSPSELKSQAYPLVSSFSLTVQTLPFTQCQ
ncbi:DUF4382 domain-containing protein [Edaphobacter bradus]|uniref:DUF4382 domain-containing protein n=1 Tax=Edaphobacter bradus TaxID=2259016 RepID=UPI0021E07CB5|nr:DUF4382 domain-containing protein [Edaphobacter bradus]